MSHGFIELKTGHGTQRLRGRNGGSIVYYSLVFYSVVLLTCLLRLPPLPATHSQEAHLSGKWIGWSVEKGQKPTEMNKPYLNMYLQLWTDGKLHFYMENHIMSNTLVDGTGTYKKKGQDYMFTGTAKFKFDDGYKKDSKTGPFNLTMHYQNGVFINDEGGMSLKLYKEGVRPATIAIRLKPSNSNGHALLEALERRYAALSSYSDDGQMTSSGEGFMANRCPFKIRFVRPGKLFVQADYFDNTGGRFGGNKIWTSGKGALEMEDQGDGYSNAFENHSLGNALFTPVEPGECYTFIVQLLMPGVSGSIEDLYKRANFKGTEAIAGHECAVLVLTSKSDYTLTLWIDAKTGLVRQAFSNLGHETDKHNPVANPTLTAKDLKP